ncbi:MAG: polysaccharide biosynthesis C-terminal domain-containing protein [Candidatus Methanomethylophilaceae archaeon]|nr:polysaccharide biosynthesis C-terminal domain-containing protein [Candidatus Methanomethylophilaceae archaeon]
MSERNGGRDVDVLLGSPRRAVLSMSVPLFFAFLVEQVQLFVDAMWCSGLGPDMLSALTIASPVYMLVTAVGSAMGIGISASAARALGEKDKGRAERLVSQALASYVVLSLLFSVVLFMASGTIIEISGGGNNQDLSMGYVAPFLLMSVPITLYNVVLGSFRAEGAAKMSMVLSVSASAINLVLDPLLIYGLDMGILGASVATCISFTAMMLAGLWLFHSGGTYLRPSFHGFRFDKDLLEDIGAVALPQFVMGAAMPLMVTPEHYMVVSCGGPEGLITYMDTFRFVVIALIPVNAVAAAMLPIVSASYGQRDLPKMKEAYGFALKITLTIAVCCGAVMLLFADQLVLVFTYSDDMVHLREEMALALRIYAVIPFVHAITRISNSFMQAATYSKLAMLSTFFQDGLFLLFFWFASKISMTAIYVSASVIDTLLAIFALALSLWVIRMVSRRFGASASSERWSSEVSAQPFKFSSA